MQILASNVYRDGCGVKPQTHGGDQEEQVDDEETWSGWCKRTQSVKEEGDCSEG